MRKHTKRKVYALRNPIAYSMAGAAITSDEKLTQQRLHELTALEAFRTGTASQDDWNELAGMVIVCETLARDRTGPEAQEACERANEALGEAYRLRKQRGHIAVTGPGLQALRDVYEYHCAQRTSIACSVYEAALLKAQRRVQAGNYALAPLAKEASAA